MGTPSRVRTRTPMASGTKARMTQPSGVRCGPRIANGSSSRAAAMASMSSSLARQFSAMPISLLRNRPERRVPNLGRVFGDRAIRREPARIRRIYDAGAQPGLAVAPGGVDFHLHRPVGVEVGAHHEIIVMRQRFDEALIPAAIVRGKYARADSVERFAQDRRGGNACAGVDAASPRGLDFGGGQA